MSIPTVSFVSVPFNVLHRPKRETALGRRVRSEVECDDYCGIGLCVRVEEVWSSGSLWGVGGVG